MTRFLLVVIWLIQPFASVSAQDTVQTYLDGNGRQCNKSKATYIRKSVVQNDGTLAVYDYFLSGALQMAGVYKTKSAETKHGLFSYYYEGGQLESQGEFVDGLREGRWEYWKKNGDKDGRGTYKLGKENGDWEWYHPNGKLSAREIYENGKIASYTFWDEYGREESGPFEAEPEFPGGEAKMMEYIQTSVIYPQKAVEMGKEGKVYVQFIVNRDGSIEQVKVMRPVHELLDAEALRVIKEMPNWTPGKQHNRLVRCRFTIPINFKLS